MMEICPRFHVPKTELILDSPLQQLSLHEQKYLTRRTLGQLNVPNLPTFLRQTWTRVLWTIRSTSTVSSDHRGHLECIGFDQSRRWCECTSRSKRWTDGPQPKIQKRTLRDFSPSHDEEAFFRASLLKKSSNLGGNFYWEVGRTQIDTCEPKKRGRFKVAI